MVIMEGFNDFLNYQPEMKIIIKENKRYIIEGIYNLSSSYKDTYLHGRYAIKIEVSKKYPKILPQVFDIDNLNFAVVKQLMNLENSILIDK